MARKTETITITDEGRDQGKVFVLTEMAAIAGERWATQALFLLGQAGSNVPEWAQGEGAGMAGFASVRLGGLPALKALQDPSLDAWWDCVQYQHAQNQMPQKIFAGSACQIEEIATINLLRMKVLELHVSPFLPVSRSTSA